MHHCNVLCLVLSSLCSMQAYYFYALVLILLAPPTPLTRAVPRTKYPRIAMKFLEDVSFEIVFSETAISNQRFPELPTCQFVRFLVYGDKRRAYGDTRCYTEISGRLTGLNA